MSTLNEDLFTANGLVYENKQDLGLVLSRQYYTARPVNQSYTSGGTIDISVNISDADFIDGRQSYLYFTLTTNHDADPNSSYGSGSASNFIDTSQVIHKDGQIIDHCIGVNRHISVMDHWTKDYGFFRAQGSLQGYHETPNGNVGGSYAVPLSSIFPLMNYKGLLPPNLINKARLRLTVARALDVIQDSNGVPFTDWTVSISNIKFVFDVYTMDKSVVNAINGTTIQMEYKSWFTERNTFSTQAITIPTRKTVAKAHRVTYIVQEGFTAISDKAGQDNMGPEENFEMTSYQWRVGTRMNPSQPVTNNEESYTQTLRAFNRFHGNSNAPHTVADYVDFYGIISLDLTRSKTNAPNDGGTPIDNNNVVDLNVKFDSVVSRVMYTHAEYGKRIVIDTMSPEQKLSGLHDKISILQ